MRLLQYQVESTGSAATGLRYEMPTVGDLPTKEQQFVRDFIAKVCLMVGLSACLGVVLRGLTP